MTTSSYSPGRPPAEGRRRAAPLLYYITDRSQFPNQDGEGCERLETRILHAARAGVDFIQLREKDLPSRELEDLAYEAAAAIDEARRDAGSGTRLLINGRVDVAIACGAAGVHLPSSQAFSVSEARIAFRKAGIAAPIIGASCHTPAEVAQVAAEGADFAVFGPVFGKGPDAVHEDVLPTGVDALRTACQERLFGMPVFALGSVTRENAAVCLRAGARGLAGIRLFQQGEVATTIEALRLAIELGDDAWEAGILGALPGVLGSMMALEVIREIVGFGEGLVGRLLMMDARSMRFETLSYEWDPGNPLSGDKPTIRDLAGDT